MLGWGAGGKKQTEEHPHHKTDDWSGPLLLQYNLDSDFKATSFEMWLEILPKVPQGALV